MAGDTTSFDVCMVKYHMKIKAFAGQVFIS